MKILGRANGGGIVPITEVGTNGLVAFLGRSLLSVRRQSQNIKTTKPLGKGRYIINDRRD
jgi:hypothetical protein